MEGTMELTFGKFKGLSIDDPKVTTKYLKWLLERMTEDAEQIQIELVRREQLEAGDSTMAQKIADAGFQALSKQHKADQQLLVQLEGAAVTLEAVLEMYFTEKAAEAKEQQLIAAREANAARLRVHARRLLSEKDTDPEDIEWARRILYGADGRA
jgi:hypothetical protein